MSAAPQTIGSLETCLNVLGVRSGMTLMVHSSLRQIGWTIGGPHAVVQALINTLGPDGTLVMPAETPKLLDPSLWDDPGVPDEWHEAVREHMPGFDATTTPSEMGAIAEAFRTWPGTLRSHHPVGSTCARGPQAALITRDHPLEFSEGEGGPFGKLHDLDAHTLLLGVGFNRCTSLHHAESLTPNRRTWHPRFLVVEDGKRRWVEAENMAWDRSTHFPLAGEAFTRIGKVNCGKIGQADSMLFSTRELVTYASEYFERVLA